MIRQAIMWEWMEDMKQEMRKNFKYNRDMIAEFRKPEKVRRILLALPYTYQQCTEMNIDDHVATDNNIAFQVVDITLEDDSNAWSVAAKSHGDPFSLEDIKDVVIDCYNPSTHPCVLTASCNPDTVYQEAVATVIFHPTVTQSTFDNVAMEVNVAANEDRLPVALSTYGGVVTTGKMLWATSRYRFEKKARGCCDPGVTPISETSLEFDEKDSCEQDCLADVECLAFNLFQSGKYGEINENTRFRCEHHRGVVTGVVLNTPDCRQTECSWTKVDF